MQKMLITGAVALSLAMAGCGNEDAEGSAHDEHAHAPPGAEPGSYEDWCGEHQVPESMCTRCNPSLTAAFKATGDWCEEHGLPESQCRVCDPDLRIERPAPPGQKAP